MGKDLYIEMFAEKIDHEKLALLSFFVPDLKYIIHFEVQQLRKEYTITDLIHFIKGQGLFVDMDEQDDEDALFKKIKKAFLYFYTAEILSYRYQTLEYLLTLSMEERKTFNRHAEFVSDISTRYIQQLLKREKIYFESRHLSYERQYNIYKNTLYKENRDLIEFREILQPCLINKAKKITDKAKLLDDITHEYVTRLNELATGLEDNNAEKIYYRYCLAKYIYKRKKQASCEGKLFTFFRSVVSQSAESKIETAEMIYDALQYGKGHRIDLKDEKYIAFHEGRLGDINNKFSNVYQTGINSRLQPLW